MKQKVEITPISVEGRFIRVKFKLNTEQHRGIGMLFRHNGWSLRSCAYPDIETASRSLYINGCDTYRDDVHVLIPTKHWDEVVDLVEGFNKKKDPEPQYTVTLENGKKVRIPKASYESLLLLAKKRKKS